MVFTMGVHTHGKEKIVGVCESKLIGKIITDGEMTLDLKNYAGFYGKKTSEQKIKEALKSATVINLIGEKAILLAKSIELLGEDELQKANNIGGIKHLQIIKVD